MSAQSITSFHATYNLEEQSHKNCSYVIGKSFRAFGNIVKTVTSSLATLGLFFIPRVLAMTPVIQAQGLIQPRRFKPYLARFIHPGLQSVIDGKIGCDIQPHIEIKNICERNAAKVLEYLQKTDPQALQLPPSYSGFSVNHDTGRSFRFRMDPKVYKNYEETLSFVESTFFGPKSPIESSPEETITYILELHKRLVRGLPDEGRLTPGKFRTKARYYSSELKLPQYLERAKSLPKKEAALFRDYLQKLQESGLIGIKSAEDEAIWQKVGLYVAPEAHLIAGQMKAFAERLLELLHEGMDPIDLAAYVHTELARISPFTIAIGRLARILTNAILARYGNIVPLVFYSKNDYLNAVDQAVMKLDYTILARYFRNILIPWNIKMLPQLKARESQYPTTFQEDTALFMKPGYVISPKGTALCSISEMEAACTTLSKPSLNNYKDALKAVEKRILQNPFAFTNEATTLADIKALYTILTEEPAVYRTIPKPKRVDRVDPEAIADEMGAFVRNLHNLLEKETDYVETAAWALKELTRISPFEKHNGELARFILLALLRRYTSLNRVIFSDRLHYRELINKALQGDLAPLIAHISKGFV